MCIRDSILILHASQLSVEHPAAFDNRRAIAGLTPLCPLIILLTVEGETPKPSASDRILVPYGPIQVLTTLVGNKRSNVLIVTII